MVPMMASEDDRVETQGMEMVQIPQSRVEWQTVLVEREWEIVEGVEEIVQRKM
jgi:hypothetical protein